jgi:cytochrome c553
MEPLARAPRSKQARKLALSERALADLSAWISARRSISTAEEAKDTEVKWRGRVRT